MTVGICGLGLIGGSMAKAYKEAGHTVLAYDIDEATLGYASLSGMIDGGLNFDTVKDCELILIALYPMATIEYLNEAAPYISNETVVMDLCGTKLSVCECGFSLAEKYGFTFVGGHPMAGKQFSGIKYSKASLSLLTKRNLSKFPNNFLFISFNPHIATFPQLRKISIILFCMYSTIPYSILFKLLKLNTNKCIPCL
jgi:prephenate dehydrogenase